MSATQEARQRHNILTPVTNSNLDLLDFALHHRNLSPGFSANEKIWELAHQKVGILQPAKLWRTVTRGVLDASCGAGREYDRATGVAKAVTDRIIPTLQRERDKEVVPFITDGQVILLEGLKMTDDPKMRAALENLYLQTLLNPALSSAWSQYLYDEAVEITRTAPEGSDPLPLNLVERAIARMQDDIYGSDGERALRTSNQRSPFAAEIIRMAQEPRVLQLPERQRKRVHDRTEELVMRVIEEPTGQHIAEDLQAVLPALHRLAPQQQVGFDLRTQAAQKAVEQRIAGTQPVAVANAHDALRTANTTGDAELHVFEAAVENSAQLWQGWSAKLSDPRTGYDVKGSTAKEIEVQIMDMQEQVSQLPAPVQAAFIQESLAGVRHILETRPTRSAINLYDRLHQVLPEGWTFYRRFVQLANMDTTMEEYAHMLDHGRYGVDGDFSIRTYLQQELHDLAQLANDINAETSFQFFQASQALKPVITSQGDVHARDFAARIYTDVVGLLTHAPEEMATEVCQLPDAAALLTVANEARAAYRSTYTGDQFVEADEIFAGEQAVNAARQHNSLQTIRLFLDSATNDIYGLEGVCQDVSAADRRIFAQLRTQIGRSPTALDAQAIFLQVAEEQMLISLRSYQSGQLMTLLTETMDDASLARGRNQLFDARMVNADYYTYLAEMYADPQIGHRAQVSANNYLQSQFDAMVARGRTRGQEVEGQMFTAAEQLLIAVERVQDGTAAQGLIRMYDSGTDSGNAVSYVADQMVQRLEIERTRITAAIAGDTSLTTDEARQDAIDAQVDVAAQNIFGSFWGTYYVRLVSPSFGKGGRADATAVMRRNADRFLEAMAKRDFVHSGSFLQAAIDQVYDRIVVSNNEDEVMRLTFWMMELATTSPIAREMKRRETSGEGTKGTKTIGRIMTDTVMKQAREDKEAIKKILVYIETRYAGPGKDQFSKPEFVMLLALWRMKMLMRTPVEGSTMGAVPGVSEWASLARSTTAAIEMALNGVRNGDDSAYMEIVMADFFASPASTVPFVPLNIGIKGGRKGTDAVLAAAEAALSEARAAKKTPQEQFYAMLKAGAIAPLMDELRVPWSKEVQAMIDIANQYPALGKPLMENVWRYFFDFARIVKKPPGISWVTDPDAASNPEIRTQQEMMLQRQFQVMDAMVRDRQFNFGMAEFTKAELEAQKRQATGDATKEDEQLLAGIPERKRLVHKAAFSLLRWGMILGNTPAEADVLKTDLRHRYLELLGDIVFDPTQTNPDVTQRQFAPEIVTAAREVLQKSFYALDASDVESFLRNLAGRADRRLGQHVLVEGGNWQNIVLNICLIPQGCERFATEADRKAGYRVEFGHRAAAVTLDLLRSWRTLAGPHGIRSAIRAIVPSGELDAISQGQSQLGLAVAEPSYPRQAINLVMALGERKPRQVEGYDVQVSDIQVLADTLAQMGQTDLHWRAMQTKELRPPRDVSTFIQASHTVTQAATQALTRLVGDYLGTIRQVNTDVGLSIVVDESGRVVELPDYPALTARLASGADTERTALLAAVGVTDREETARQIGKSLFESIDQRDPVGIAKVTFQLMKEYGINTDNLVEQMMDAIKTSGQVPAVRTEDGGAAAGDVTIPSRLVYFTPGSEGVGLMVAQLLGQSMANKAVTAQAVENMMGQILGNKEVLAGMTRAMVESTGGTETAEAIENMRRILINGVVDVLTDEQARAKLVATLRSENESRRSTRVSKIEGLLKEYDAEQVEMAGGLQREEVARLKRELTILRQVSEARFTAAEQTLTQFLTVYPQLAEEFVATSLRPAQLLMQHLRAYQQWLDRISAPEGMLAEMADAYDRQLAAVNVPVVTQLPTTASLLEQVRGKDEAGRIQSGIELLGGARQQALPESRE